MYLKHLLFITVFFFSCELLAQSIPTAIIKSRLENVDKGQHINVAGERLFSSVLVPRYYAESNYKMGWLINTTDLNYASKAITAIENVYRHGLNPEDYHFKTLGRLFGRHLAAVQEGTSNPRTAAEIDILLTDAYIMLASHLYMGKVNPESIKAEWKIQRGRDNTNFDEMLRTLTDRLSDPDEILMSFAPKLPTYQRMMVAMESYVQLAHQTEYTKVSVSKSIHPGDTTELIETIRAKMVALGYLSPYPLQNIFAYDPTLEAAVKKFQKLHGLNQDGIIGKGTAEAMNISVAERIKLLEINLERYRWLPWYFEGRYVQMNIPDQRVYLMDNFDTLFTARAIVGRAYRKTPVFTAKMDHLVFSPTWTIPPTILANDIIPAVKKDANYLRSKNMQVITSSGQPVPQENIDWSKMSGRNFPYMIRQSPGPDNALGRVKFMFPNSYNVYMHDTPNKELFARDERIFSSGCIRIENPTTLAEILLQSQSNWTSERIREAMNSNREQTVRLQTPIDVYIGYFTAWTDAQMLTHFRKDIYSRDESLYKALKSKS
jgi:murein L,D-transpeptidase YcbB/YkuD